MSPQKNPEPAASPSSLNLWGDGPSPELNLSPSRPLIMGYSTQTDPKKTFVRDDTSRPLPPSLPNLRIIQVLMLQLSRVPAPYHGSSDLPHEIQTLQEVGPFPDIQTRLHLQVQALWRRDVHENRLLCRSVRKTRRGFVRLRTVEHGHLPTSRALGKVS